MVYKAVQLRMDSRHGGMAAPIGDPCRGLAPELHCLWYTRGLPHPRPEMSGCVTLGVRFPYKFDMLWTANDLGYIADCWCTPYSGQHRLRGCP